MDSGHLEIRPLSLVFDPGVTGWPAEELARPFGLNASPGPA